MTRIMTVIGEGRVLADAANGIVRGWCENPHDGRTMRAIRRFFPGVEEKGHLLRLGGFRRLTGEGSLIATLVDAKMSSSSQFVQSLHLFEDSNGEGMQTINKAGLIV